MNIDIILVLLALIGMIAALIWDRLRPGMVLLTVVVFFLCVGILTPKEMLEGFSNKGMITVGLLFLVSEGIRQSGALGQVVKKLLPQGKTTVCKAQLRMLPSIAFISAFLNNTPVVVIFAPIIKRWAEAVKLPATKFLIPLSYVTILGGLCTLIGTSTNLVVHGMVLDAGFEGFSMFELGMVGVPVALAGILYILLFSKKLLPDSRTGNEEEDDENHSGNLHRVEAVLGSRFPGINKTLGEFNFTRHYGAIVKEVKSGGETFTHNLDKVVLHEGDTLVLWADDTFVPTWGESSVFLLLANGNDGTEPVFGVVYAPAADELYFTQSPVQAFGVRGGRTELLKTRAVPAEGFTVFNSRSHFRADEAARLLGNRTVAKVVRRGSSLKFCDIAAGRGDAYPCTHETHEWDTAAAHAVLKAAGGVILDASGAPLAYRKPELKNPRLLSLGKSPFREKRFDKKY